MSSEYEVTSSPAEAGDPCQFGSRRNRSIGGGEPDPGAWLAAIIDGSDDAIVSKNLSGVIQSWNGGATRLFGYSADEAIGKPIAILVPDNLMEEETAILAQIQLGKRVERFETKRRRKDGSLIDISLTISAIRNENGVIIGASRVARDITDRLLAREQHELLMGEMYHRVKNLFAVAGAIVSISAKSATRESDVIDDIRARLVSLARAHELTMADRLHSTENRQGPSLLALTGRILDPYAGDGRITIMGDDCNVGDKAVSYLSLLLHELATNAAKFGSLSVGSGRLDVRVAADNELVHLFWRETGGPQPSPGEPTGFGSRLERSVAGALNAMIGRDWRSTGLVATITMPREVLTA
ncbi:MAG: PAS domain S-box protein [Xanthobacteraceae bacterium]